MMFLQQNPFIGSKSRGEEMKTAVHVIRSHWLQPEGAFPFEV